MRVTADIFKALFLGYLLLWINGCAFLAGAAAGTATYVYVEGDSKAAYPVPFDRMWKETQAMVKAKGVGVTEHSRENGKGSIKGKLADGKDVTVNLAAENPQVTEVSIRVGVVPDREAAEDLQKDLARRVGVKLPL